MLLYGIVLLLISQFHIILQLPNTIPLPHLHIIIGVIKKGAMDGRFDIGNMGGMVNIGGGCRFIRGGKGGEPFPYPSPR
jgi:hypothetical protein